MKATTGILDRIRLAGTQPAEHELFTLRLCEQVDDLEDECGRPRGGV